MCCCRYLCVCVCVCTYIYMHTYTHTYASAKVTSCALLQISVSQVLSSTFTQGLICLTFTKEVFNSTSMKYITLMPHTISLVYIHNYAVCTWNVTHMHCKNAFKFPLYAAQVLLCVTSMKYSARRICMESHIYASKQMCSR